MEHLSPESRQKVIKLVQAGYREVDVAKLDRATLLEYYAKVLLTETAYVRSGLAVTFVTLVTLILF